MLILAEDIFKFIWAENLILFNFKSDNADMINPGHLVIINSHCKYLQMEMKMGQYWQCK